MDRSSNTHVVIIGAGPYGLSLASHLRAAGVPHRIYGRPMHSWATQMPAGMKLKSDGFASNLSSGSVPFTLEDFCHLTGRPYHATHMPVPVEDFVAYGQEFQRRFVPSLDPRNVTHIDGDGERFRVTVDGGAEVFARHVVVATGVSLYQYIPDTLRNLPAGFVSHTADHQTFTEFAGKDVAVVGRGASALNAAVLLAEDGAKVSVLTRRQKIHIHVMASREERGLWERLRHPSSPLGSGMRSWLSSKAPGLFHVLPAPLRRLLVYKHLGPAGGSALQGRLDGNADLLLGWSIDSAQLVGNEGAQRVKLHLISDENEERELETSHVIAGTGYRVDMTRLRFLSDKLLGRIRVLTGGAPRLNARFESSVPHLYFVGPTASGSFGPLQRFAAGAAYAAAQMTRHFVRDLSRAQPRGRFARNVAVAANSDRGL